ncbi:hypothetical protein F383_05847 [Gossypium arboreum]|uniref:Uncharacterized protein n=1 Tax=Gossypium arboreum TaxID=29729 RepID=A0A0B0NG61_GOSAR|nr:hypothetical protein F383_05847 [Gossypium arboreum]
MIQGRFQPRDPISASTSTKEKDPGGVFAKVRKATWRHEGGVPRHAGGCKEARWRLGLRRSLLLGFLVD